jgi:hypothetical protein
MFEAAKVIAVLAWLQNGTSQQPVAQTRIY